jgi:hypothetical protein
MPRPNTWFIDVFTADNNLQQPLEDYESEISFTRNEINDRIERWTALRNTCSNLPGFPCSDFGSNFYYTEVE